MAIKIKRPRSMAKGDLFYEHTEAGRGVRGPVGYLLKCFYGVPFKDLHLWSVYHEGGGNHEPPSQWQQFVADMTYLQGPPTSPVVQRTFADVIDGLADVLEFGVDGFCAWCALHGIRATATPDANCVDGNLAETGDLFEGMEAER